MNYNMQVKNQEEYEQRRKNAIKGMYKEELQKQLVEREAEKRYLAKRQVEFER